MRGHITIYFSLLLLIIFSLLCTTIESARLGGVRIRCQSSAYLALESVFADYSLPVAREYGLLMLDKSYGTDDAEKYKEYLLDYMSYNAAPNKELLVRGADFAQVQPQAVSLHRERVISEEGGRALEEEILAYMKHAAPVGLLEWIMERLGLLEQSEVVTSIFEKLSGLRAQAAQVDLAVQRMHRGMENIKEYPLDVAGAADSIRPAVEELYELYEICEELEAEVITDPKAEKRDEELDRLYEAIDMLQKSISLQVQDLVQEHSAVLEYHRDVDGSKTRYDTNTQLVAEKLADMEQTFEDGREKLEEEISTAIETELSAMRKYSAGEGDYYEVTDGTQDIPPNMSVLEGNIASLSPYMYGDVRGVESALDSCEAAMGSYRTDRLQLNYTDETAGGTGVDVMERVGSLLSSGLLGLVAENPSKLSNQSYVPENPYEALLRGYAYTQEELAEQILVNEYLLMRLGNLLEPAKDRLFAYEAEYILAGKESDKENLAVVAAQLLMLRSGMNLVYLLGNAEKQSEAEGLAVLLAGFTGMKGIIEVTKLLILTVWAQAEGIADVRALFSGARVPFTKDDTSWKLSLTGLTSLSSANLPCETEVTDGLDYKDYLRLLLLKEKRSTRNGRTMDLIEGLVKKKYDKGFSLSECVTELEIHTTFHAKPIFLKLPFLERKSEAGDYQIEGTSSYAY